MNYKNHKKEISILSILIAPLVLLWIFPNHRHEIYGVFVLFAAIGVIIYILYSFQKGEMPVPWIEGTHKIDFKDKPREFWKYFIIELLAAITLVILCLVGIFLI